MQSVMLGTRVAPELAIELRRRAEAQDTTVSRVIAGIVRRALQPLADGAAPGAAGHDAER